MSAAAASAVFAAARAAGVELSVVGGKLASRGPAAPELRAAIRENKAALIELLSEARGSCVHCGEPVTWTNGLRNWFGELTHMCCGGKP